MDVLRIEALMVDCVVGVYPHERDMVQPLQVDVELHVDTELAGVHESFASTVDYASAAAQIVFLLRSCRFHLLETAAHVLSRYLLAPPVAGGRVPQVEAVRIRLTKPEALGGLALPSLEVHRTASWASPEVETTAFGTVDVIHETKEAGIYRLNVGPGRDIPLHLHRQMRESEMVLGDGLLCQGKPCPPGTVHRWPLGAPHTYSNPTLRTQSILCVDAPRFIDEDEVSVTGEPAEVVSEDAWGPTVGTVLS